MFEKFKAKAFYKNIPIFLGIIGATLIGFVEGIGIEQALTDQILKSIRDGNIVGLLAYTFIFVLIWLEVRGLKRGFFQLNETIANSFARGETRFVEIEHRLSVLENKHS